MTDPTASAGTVRHRVRHGLRRSANWFQLLRFGAVGASGYVVNLIVFKAMVDGAGTDFRLAAVAAWLVAVTNNFFWNRHWTFSARDGHAGFQAARFLTVSLGALVVNLIALEVLVSGAGMPEFEAQALAIVIATPCNFLGNKLWSFAS